MMIWLRENRSKEQEEPPTRRISVKAYLESPTTSPRTLTTTTTAATATATATAFSLHKSCIIVKQKMSLLSCFLCKKVTWLFFANQIQWVPDNSTLCLVFKLNWMLEKSSTVSWKEGPLIFHEWPQYSFWETFKFELQMLLTRRIITKTAPM